MNGTIVTNNPRVRDAYASRYETDYRSCSYEALLKAVRDRVHRGDRILTHPLYGSVKPRETPYRSVFLEQGNGRTDSDSVSLIESAILSIEKFRDKAVLYDASLLEDCQQVDLALFQSAIRAMEAEAL